MSTRAEFFQSMYPGLSDGEVIDELIKASIRRFSAQEVVTMQEEIEHKTVNLAISTTKLSARTLLRGMQFLLRQYDKHASQGKQSMKRLVRQNRGVTNVEMILAESAY